MHHLIKEKEDHEYRVSQRKQVLHLGLNSQ